LGSHRGSRKLLPVLDFVGIGYVMFGDTGTGKGKYHFLFSVLWGKRNLLSRAAAKLSSSQNGRGWKGPLWVI